METLKQWQTVKVGSSLVIKDEETIKDALANGAKGAINGIETQVVEVIVIHETSGACTWRILRAQKDVQDKDNRDYFILIKSVGDAFDVRVYQENSWFSQGTRGDIITRNDFFLFQEPKGDWTPKDLEFAVSFPINIEGKDVFFDQKNPTLYGKAGHAHHVIGGSHGLFAAVIEYSTGEPVSNPEILVYEIGGIKNGEMQEIGGWVTFLEGRTIRSDEVAVLRV